MDRISYNYLSLSRKIVVSFLGRVRYVCFRVLSFTMISSRGPIRAL